jgi:hypothetical protein
VIRVDLTYKKLLGAIDMSNNVAGMVLARTVIAQHPRYSHFYFGGGGKKERILLGRIDPANFFRVNNHIIHWYGSLAKRERAIPTFCLTWARSRHSLGPYHGLATSGESRFYSDNT